MTAVAVFTGFQFNNMSACCGVTVGAYGDMSGIYGMTI